MPIAEQTQQRDLAPCEDTANLASQRPNSVLPQEAIRKLRPAPGLRWVLHHNAPTHRRAGLTPVTIARPQLEDITQMGDGVRKTCAAGISDTAMREALDGCCQPSPRCVYVPSSNPEKGGHFELSILEQRREGDG